MARNGTEPRKSKVKKSKKKNSKPEPAKEPAPAIAPKPTEPEKPAELYLDLLDDEIVETYPAITVLGNGQKFEGTRTEYMRLISFLAKGTVKT